MSDLLDEVEEAVRNDRIAQYFKRNGKYYAAIVLAVIVGSGGLSLYKNMEKSRNERATGEYILALKNAEDSQPILAELAKTSGAGTGLLAKFQYAAALNAKGQVSEARVVLNSVIADGKLTDADRNFARVRLALLELDAKQYDAALAITPVFKTQDTPFRFLAYEIEALANWAKGDAVTARAGFELIINDAGAPTNFKQRASVLLGMIDGGTKLTF